MYVVGFTVAGMIGIALGGSLAAEHGVKRVVPWVVIITVAAGSVLGWALNGWIAYAAASSYH